MKVWQHLTNSIRITCYRLGWFCKCILWFGRKDLPCAQIAAVWFDGLHQRKQVWIHLQISLRLRLRTYRLWRIRMPGDGPIFSRNPVLSRFVLGQTFFSNQGRNDSSHDNVLVTRLQPWFEETDCEFTFRNPVSSWFYESGQRGGEMQRLEPAGLGMRFQMRRRIPTERNECRDADLHGYVLLERVETKMREKGGISIKHFHYNLLNVVR